MPRRKIQSVTTRVLADSTVHNLESHALPAKASNIRFSTCLCSRNLKVRPLLKMAQASIHLQIYFFHHLNESLTPSTISPCSFETGIHDCNTTSLLEHHVEIILNQPGTSQPTISHTTSGIQFRLGICLVCRKASIWRTRAFLTHELSPLHSTAVSARALSAGVTPPHRLPRRHLRGHGSSPQVLPRKR